jgi:subtilisin family serine protease
MKLFVKLNVSILIILISFFAIFDVNSINNHTNTQLIDLSSNDPVKVYQAGKGKSKYKSNELIINFNVEDYSYLEDKYNIKVNDKLDSDNYLIEFNPNEYTMEEILILANKEPGIEYAEPNYVMKLAYSPVSEQFYDYLWAFKNPTYGINITPVWDETFGRDEVVVAIADSGIDYTHPDLISNIWINTEEILGNGIDDDGNGYIDDYYGWNFYQNNNNVMDYNGHGTHVGGIIAAEINGEGIVGTAPNVKIMALKVSDIEGNVYLDKVVSSINYAVNKGVKIFNFSFGGPVQYQAFGNAIANTDALFLCAAGNDGTNNDILPFYPASYNYNNIISVAAHRETGVLADFSNYGINSVDVSAPGHNILSTYPLSLTPDGYYPYIYFNGTSMAAPYVSGLAALLWSQNSNYSVSEIRNYILSNVKTYGSFTTKVSTGGIIDASKSYSALIDSLYDGGSGTIEDPYLISNVEQFNNIRNNLAASYRLTSNLDFTYDTTNVNGLFYNNGKGWLPIGNNESSSSGYTGNAFNGNFDGNGYVIKGLNINRPSEYYLGLFGNVVGIDTEHSTIKNLILENGNIKGQGYIGGLIGYAQYVDISNVGTNLNIIASDMYIGGVVGYIEGNINKSYNTALIEASSKAGGIAGSIMGDIYDTFNLGIMNRYNDINVTDSGGIVGVLSGSMSNSYNLGMLRDNNFKFFVGLNNGGIIDNVYYYNPYNLNEDIYGVQLTESEIYESESYINFDFDNVWQININSKLPTLRGMPFHQLTDYNVADKLTLNIKKDQSYNLNITNNPSFNLRKNYVYSSDDENIVTVDKNGKITPIKIGNAVIEIYSIELGVSKYIDVEVKIVKGDVNNDGNVTITDLVKLSRHLAGLETIQSNYLENADINNDGNVTITDLVKLSRHLAGLEGI